MRTVALEALGAVITAAWVVFVVAVFVIVVRRAFGRYRHGSRRLYRNSPLHDLSRNCGAPGCGQRHGLHECVMLNDRLLRR